MFTQMGVESVAVGGCQHSSLFLNGDPFRRPHGAEIVSRAAVPSGSRSFLQH